VVPRPVFELKIKGAAVSKIEAGQSQSIPLPSPVVEDPKVHSAGLRRDDENASALMQRIRQMLVQRDGIRSAEKRIAEVSSGSAVDEPEGAAVDAETSKQDVREVLLEKLQAEKALLRPAVAPGANMDLEEMERRLKAHAKLRIRLAREKGVVITPSGVTTGTGAGAGTRTTVAGGLSIKGAAGAAATEQNLRAKLLSRRNDVAN
jgi:hypothetical protein